MQIIDCLRRDAAASLAPGKLTETEQIRIMREALEGVTECFKTGYHICGDIQVMICGEVFEIKSSDRWRNVRGPQIIGAFHELWEKLELARAALAQVIAQGGGPAPAAGKD